MVYVKFPRAVQQAAQYRELTAPPPLEIIIICAGFIMDSSAIFHAYWSVSVNPSGTAAPCHLPLQKGRLFIKNVAALLPGLLRSPAQGRLLLKRIYSALHRGGLRFHRPPCAKGAVCVSRLRDCTPFHNPSDTAVPCHHPRVCYAAPTQGRLFYKKCCGTTPGLA